MVNSINGNMPTLFGRIGNASPIPEGVAETALNWRHEGSSQAYIVDLSPEAMEFMSCGSGCSGMMDAMAFATSQSELTASQKKKVEALNKELDSIFGVPKSLSAEEKAQEKNLIEQINKLLGVSDQKPFSEETERKLETLYNKIDEIFADGKVTKEEGTKLIALEKRIDEILGSNKSPNELSQADQKKLDELFAKLDSLYGVKEPSKDDLVRAENIFAELEAIHNSAALGAGVVAGASLDALSKQDQAKAESLLKELDAIFGSARDANELSKEDQKKVDAIIKRIDELLGVQTPSESEMARIAAIQQEFAAMFKDANFKS